MGLSNHFNWASFKSKSLTLLIEHSPCCLLSFASGFLGVSVLNHNPVLELGFALSGALIGDHIGHKYFNQDCCKDDKKSENKLRRYALALSFGLASWGAHQMFFHDHDEVNAGSPDAAIHQHDCEHTDYKSQPSFASAKLQKALDEIHRKHHQEACAPN
jgi:hypothetical protein